jgi:hypothetical protein
MNQRLVTRAQTVPIRLNHRAMPGTGKNWAKATKKSVMPEAPMFKAIIKRRREARLSWPDGVEVRPRSLKKFEKKAYPCRCGSVIVPPGYKSIAMPVSRKKQMPIATRRRKTPICQNAFQERPFTRNTLPFCVVLPYPDGWTKRERRSDLILHVESTSKSYQAGHNATVCALNWLTFLSQKGTTILSC